MNRLCILKNQVAEILEMIPQTRNDDKKLYIEIIKKYYRHFLVTSPAGREYLPIERIVSLPNMGNVIRYRAYAQRDGLYMPTDPAVIERRFKSNSAQRDFRESLDYAS